MAPEADLYRSQSKFPRPEPHRFKKSAKSRSKSVQLALRAGAEHLAPVEPKAMTDAYVLRSTASEFGVLRNAFCKWGEQIVVLAEGT